MQKYQAHTGDLDKAQCGTKVIIVANRIIGSSVDLKVYKEWWFR